MRLAYTSRDTVEYRKILALDYKARSYDASDSVGLQIGNFTRVDEEKHIKKLREDPNITNVILDLNPMSSWTRTSVIGDTGEEWAQIVISRPRFEIDDAALQTTWVADSNELFTFSFRPNVQAPGDTLWEVVRWFEDPL